MGRISKFYRTQFEKKEKEYFNDVVKTMKSEAHKKSGALRDSITIERYGLLDAKIGVDSQALASDPRNVSKKDYSEAYLNGHGGYTILPKKAKALRWLGDDGKYHYAKSVYIPPRAGDPFIKRTLLKLKKFSSY